MGYLMEGYTRNARGGISNRRFDSEQFPGPSQGWYDSPDKVPLLPGQAAEPAPVKQHVSQSEGQVSANLGTHDARAITMASMDGRSQSVEARERAKAALRRNGRFVGGKGKR